MSVYTLRKRPAEWVSAHDVCMFEYRLPQGIISTTINNGGKVQFVLSTAFPITPLVGDRVFVTGNSIYKGYHVITEVIDANNIVLNVDYVSVVSGSVPIWLAVSPVIKVFAGWDVGELTVNTVDGVKDFSDFQPKRLVGEFMPEPSLDGYLRFDIHGYLKAALPTPYEPYEMPNESQFNFQLSSSTFFINMLLFTKVDVMLNDARAVTLNVANTGLSMSEWNRYYAPYNLIQPKNIRLTYNNRQKDYYKVNNLILWQ